MIQERLKLIVYGIHLPACQYPSRLHDKFPNACTNKDVVRAVSASTNEDIVQITKLHCETAADGTSCASRLFRTKCSKDCATARAASAANNVDAARNVEPWIVACCLPCSCSAQGGLCLVRGTLLANLRIARSRFGVNED